MNRLTKIEAVNKINEKELQMGISGDTGKSWHQKYADSAWIYVGNLPYDLNEGDLIAVFSQYGEIVNVNLIRDWKTGKSKGFGFLCYQDQRSTVLAVDNLNGIKLVGRVVQVDHCDNYKIPKYREDAPEEIRRIWEEGCAPKPLNISEEEAGKKARRERKEQKRKLRQLEEVVELLPDEVSSELRKARKRVRKEKRALDRAMRRERKRLEGTPEDERGRADDEGRWDERKKKLDDADMLDDAKFYGQNDHFNFGKKRKEVPAGPTHNIRPDFDKADWRDIEMFKQVREYERQTKGEKEVHWKEQEHFVPNRLKGRKQ